MSPHVEQLLLMCGGTTPTEFNPTPGFTAVSRTQLPKFMATFIAFSDEEQELVRCIEVLLQGNYTQEDHREFRKALYSVYREQGFSPEELIPDFPDIQVAA